MKWARHAERHGQLEEMLRDAASRYANGDPVDVRLFTGVAQSAQAVGSAALEGQAWYLGARVALDSGAPSDALAMIDCAARAFETAGLPLELARTALGRMHVLDDLGRHELAIRVGHEALAAIPHLQHLMPVPSAELTWLEAALNENVGASCGYTGDHASALASYRVAQDLYTTSDDCEEDRARCTANIGVELVDLGRAAEGIAALGEAEGWFLAAGRRTAAAKCAAHRAAGLLLAGRYSESLDALDLSSRLDGSESESTDAYRAQLIRGEVCLSLHLLPEADEAFLSLCRRFDSRGLAHDGARALRGRAIARHRLGDAPAATRAMVDAHRRFGAVGDRAMEAVTFVELAYIAGTASEDELERAGATLASMGRRPDQAAALLTSLDLGLCSQPRATIDRVGELLDGVDLPDLTWQWMLHDALHPVGHRDPVSQLQRLDDAETVLERIRHTIPSDRSRLTFMGSRRRVHEAAIALLLAQGHTAEAFRRSAATRAKGLSRLKASADADHGTATGGCSAVILYEMIGDELLSFRANGASVECRRNVSSRGRLDVLQRRVDALARRALVPSLTSARWRELGTSAKRLLSEVYDELLRPVLGDEAPTSVWIVPAGPVANIPFAALFDGHRFLAEMSTIVMSPTTPVASCLPDDGTPIGRVLLVGVPDDRTPMIPAEVEAIRQEVMAPTVLLGAAATAEAVHAQLETHDVIHLACHGSHRADNPLLSSLQLADRAVTAAEIADWPLRGQLVVLNACWSGRHGYEGNVDEPLGLTRALIAAGARAVVVNRWHVGDVTACDVITRLYRALRDNSPPAALRTVQRELMMGGWHPHEWAGPAVYVSPFTTKRGSASD